MQKNKKSLDHQKWSLNSLNHRFSLYFNCFNHQIFNAFLAKLLNLLINLLRYTISTMRTLNFFILFKFIFAIGSICDYQGKNQSAHIGKIIDDPLGSKIIERLHRCWWRMLETKCVFDKIWTLVTSHVTNIES